MALWTTEPAVPVDVPVTVTVAGIGLVTCFIPLQAAKKINANIAAAMARRKRTRFVFGSSMSSRNARITGTICRIEAGGTGTDGGGTISAVVVTITAAFCAVTPSAAITGVVTVQVERAAAGVTAQVSPTF